jgi:acid phosphatase type 7
VNLKVFRRRLGSVRRIAGSGAHTVLSAVRSLLDRTHLEEPPPREPYVQGVTASSAVIAWVGDEPGVGAVEYGETPRLGRRRADSNTGRRHAVALTDLRPASTYHYRVVGSDRSKAARFRTAPARGAVSFSFAVVGDSGDGGKAQLAVARLLGHLKPDLILHAGDVVYPRGKEKDYDRRFFTPYRTLIREVPLFPVLGNHDVQHRDGAAYLNNFHPPLHSPRSTKRFYSFDWGDAHFVAIDSELYYDDRGGNPQEQRAFLQQDLASTRKRWRFAFLHRSLYSSSRHGDDEKIREDLEPLLAHHGVDVVFSGHDHVYERTAPIKGVTHVVSGGGGRELYPAGEGKWTACSKSTHHAVLVHVDDSRIVLEAVEPDGSVFDRWHLVRT